MAGLKKEVAGTRCLLLLSAGCYGTGAENGQAQILRFKVPQFKVSPVS